MHDSLAPSLPDQTASIRRSSRELEAEFYRKIGLSAVAAALAIPPESRPTIPDRSIRNGADVRPIGR